MKNNKLQYFLTIVVELMLAINIAFATSPNTSILLIKAEKAYEQNLFDVAVQYYEKYLQNIENQQNTEILLKIADSYWQMRKYEKSKTIYYKLAEKDKSVFTSSDKIKLSQFEARLKNYKEAALWLQNEQGYENRINSFLDRKKIDYITEDSADWNVKLLNINTQYREFSPILYKNTLYYSSNRPQEVVTKANGWDGKNYVKLWATELINLKSISNNEKKYYDLFSTENTDNTTIISEKKIATLYELSDTKPQIKRNVFNVQDEVGVLKPIKTDFSTLLSGLNELKYNVSSASFDSLNNIYFSANQNLSNNESKISLYQGKINANTISNIKQIFFSKTPKNGNLMHPTVNSDGTKLIFASNAEVENGTYDLYLAQRNNANSEWQIAQKITNLNTVGNEVFPVINNDDYLYFSSDAREGYGGLDIYKVKLSDLSTSTPEIELLGYPINSSSDDFGMMTDKAGVTGYFTSDRQVENDNIYSFEYNPLPKLSHISGLIREKKTKQLLPGATVFLLNRTNNEVLVDKADNNGRYTFDVHNLGDFTIRGIEENYKDDCLSLNIFSEKPKDVTFNARDLMLELTFKKVFVLNNLFYDFDKWNIRKDAEPPLDTLITILKTYPIKVELGSHTDSRGSDKYNERLSQRRAESAVNYIIQKGGISPDRITAKGYGETKPVNKCVNGIDCTEEEHQLNRRTEITVLYNPSPANSLDPLKYNKGQKLTINDFPKGYFDNCK